MEEIKKCPKCAEEVLKEAKKCKHCGADLRKWLDRHKILAVVLGLIIFFILLGVLGGGDSKLGKSSETKEAVQTTVPKEYRFAGRPDAQEKDIEILPGESATLEGVRLTVVNVTRTTVISEFEKAESGKEFVIVEVALENTSDKAQSYNALYFRIQTAGGQVLDPGFVVLEDGLHSGDLVTGGKVSGRVPFEVPKEEGHQYLIYKPNVWKTDRIIAKLQ